MNARFLWSGFVAFCFETLIFVGLFYALLPKPKELYTAKDKTQLEFIQIDQIIAEVPKQKEKPMINQEKRMINDEKELQKNTKQEKSFSSSLAKEQKIKSTDVKKIFSSPNSGSGVKKLFEKVDSSNPPINKEETYDDRLAFSANSIQSKNYAYSQQDSQKLAKETSKLKDTLNQIWEKELEMTSTPPQDMADGKYDEWFAKVKNILYTRWDKHLYESVSIVVHITITNQGKFSYRIIRKSKNSSYNTYMENLLKSLCQENFPPYPKGDQKSIEVTFKTKEQGNV